MSDLVRRGSPCVDEANQCVWWGDRRIDLAPKAFLVLRRLMQQPNQIVTKNDLLEAAWPDTHVSDGVLTLAINQLREALGDSARQASFIETVHRRGYRWIGPLSPMGSSLEPVPLFIVGRDAALAQLEQAFSSAVGGSRQIVFVTGEPGIGKTTLVDEFLRVLGVRCNGVAAARTPPRNTLTANIVPPFLIARGQCVDSFGSSEAYMPVLEALERLCRDSQSDQPVDLLRRLAPTWMLQLPQFLKAGEREELRRIVTGSRNERVVRELLYFVEALTADRSLVLVLEDLHWSDQATVGALAALAARREPARLLILVSYRPSDAIARLHPITRLKHELSAKRQCVEIAIGGLDHDAVAAYLARRFPSHRLLRELAAELQAHTGGNPLFIRNALDDFVRRGWLEERCGAWECTVDLETLVAAVPENTREMIAFRLQQLSESDLQMLEAASVIGQTFATQALAAVLQRDPVDVEGDCARLARAEQFLAEGQSTIWPDGSPGCQQNFRHALYRQVLHGRVPPARRQLFHRRVADRMQSTFERRSDDVGKLLSHHLEHAGDFFRAVDLLQELAQHAYERCATHEAESLLGHAVMVLKRAPMSEMRQRRLLEVAVAHTVALAALHGPEGDQPLRRTIDEARTLAQSIPTAPESIAAIGFTAVADIFGGRLRQACALGEQQLAFAGRDPAPDLALSAHGVLAIAQLYLGEVKSAISHVEAAFAARESAISRAVSLVAAFDPIVGLRMLYGLAKVLSGQAGDGWASVLAGLHHARSDEALTYLAPGLSQATGIALVRGDLVAARSFAVELIALCETRTLPLFREAAHAQLAWLDFKETRDPALLATMRNAVVDFTRIGHLGRPRLWNMLADAYLTVGRIDEATRALDEAFDTRGEECAFDAELFRQRAAIGLSAGSAGRAEEFLARAIEVANTQGAHLFGLRATVDLCQLWRQSGKQRQARQQLHRALESFGADSAEADVRVARTLLHEIG